MTVTYSDNLFRALFHWKGSVWKILGLELFIYLIIFYSSRIILFVVTRAIGVPNGYWDTIENLIEIFNKYTDRLPIEFILSFYVNQAVNRWWNQVTLMPWPDETLAHTCSVLYKNDDDTKSRRHTVARLTLLSIILGYKNVSEQAVNLYSNLSKLQNSGLLTAEEKEIIEMAPTDVQYEIPLQWIHEIVRSKTDSTQGSLVLALNTFRSQLKNMTHFNEIRLPLVYTQTATVALYGFFLFSILGNLAFEEPDPYVPFVAILKFIFMVGWLKVAQNIATPFGDDDDDIELTEWLNRHIRFSFVVTDYAMVKMPSESNWIKDDTTLSKVLNSFPRDDIGKRYDMKENIFDKFNSIFYSKTVTKL